MSIDRLSLSASNHTAAIGGTSAGQGSGAAARAVAVEVLGRLGTQFVEAASQWPAGQSEAYPLGEWSEALGSQLGATPLQTMELEGALGALAGALAADMAALADGRTLDRLDTALAETGEPQLPTDASTLARHFEDLASHIAQAR